MKIQWTELLDDDDNTCLEAPSPYTNDGDPIMWRLRQRLINNKKQWYECHDSELMDILPDFWRTLKKAKKAIQEAHDGIIQELSHD